MKLSPETVADNATHINSVIDRALHTASRQDVGLSLLSLAHAFAANTAPEANMETQVCLAMVLVQDALNDISGGNEFVSVFETFRQQESHAS